MGIFLYERKLNRRLTFFSRNVISNRQTLLEGLEWKPRKWISRLRHEGIGSNQHYFASALEVETEKLAFRTSYVITGDKFHRITVISPMSSEVNKGNIQMLYKPTNFVTITTGHQNILEPLTPGGAMQQASVNQVSTDFHIQKFYFGSGMFTSECCGTEDAGDQSVRGAQDRTVAGSEYQLLSQQAAKRRDDDDLVGDGAGKHFLEVLADAADLTHERANDVRFRRRLHEQPTDVPGGLSECVSAVSSRTSVPAGAGA